MLILGAVLVVAGTATLSVGAAMICGGVLVVAAAVALAAVQDRVAAQKPPEPVE